jgi:hypothetical protein
VILLEARICSHIIGLSLTVIFALAGTTASASARTPDLLALLLMDDWRYIYYLSSMALRILRHD